MFKKKCFWSIVIYSNVLVSSGQQSESVIQTCIFTLFKILSDIYTQLYIK